MWHSIVIWEQHSFPYPIGAFEYYQDQTQCTKFGKGKYITSKFTQARISWQTVLPYTQRNMHTVFALLCFVVVIHWLIFPYPSGLLHWHCGNVTIAPVPAKQPWWIWINTLCEFIMNDYITTTKQSTTKPCAYFVGYTVPRLNGRAMDASRE